MEIVYSLKTGRWVKKTSPRRPKPPHGTLVCSSSRTSDEIDALVRSCVLSGPLPLSATLHRGDTLTLRENPAHCAVLLEVVESPVRPLRGRVLASDISHHVGYVFYYSPDEVDVGPEVPVPEVEEPVTSLAMQMQGKLPRSLK